MEKYLDFEKVKQIPNIRKTKKAFEWLIGLVILLFIFWFTDIFKVPKNYRVVKPVTDGQVSQYLTNYILPQLHNKSQYGQPFDLVISEDGINDIIIRHIDANSLQRSNLSNLSVTFKKGRILLTGKTVYYNFDFIVTIVLKPYIDKKGYFFLGVSKIQAGQSRIPFAAGVAEKKVLGEFGSFLNNSDNADFIKVLFSGGKVEPVFYINRKKVRIEKMMVMDKELVIYFLPE
jgi:hypothetical protein